MRVWEVMTDGAQTVPPSMAATAAREVMRRNRIHHLIVKRGSQIVGVVSDRDLGGRAGTVQPNDTVADLMTADVATAQRTETVRQAAKRMQGRVIGCLPVLEGDRLVGIVTISDLLRLLGRGIDRPTSPERPLATHRVAHRKQRGHGKPGTW